MTTVGDLRNVYYRQKAECGSNTSTVTWIYGGSFAKRRVGDTTTGDRSDLT